MGYGSGLGAAGMSYTDFRHASCDPPLASDGITNTVE
jgi:hypothetical protein